MIQIFSTVRALRFLIASVLHALGFTGILTTAYKEEQQSKSLCDACNSTNEHVNILERALAVSRRLSVL